MAVAKYPHDPTLFPDTRVDIKQVSVRIFTLLILSDTEDRPLLPCCQRFFFLTMFVKR